MTENNNTKLPKIYCLGPGGTFSILAAQKFLSQNKADILPVRVISDVLKGVSDNYGNYGVLPIENTVAGVVGAHQDLLIYYHRELNIKILAEVFCEIKFGLIANDNNLNNVKFVYAHPHAAEQCQIYRTQHLKNAQIKFVVSTVSAGREFLKKVDEGQSIGAIVPLPYIFENKDVKKFYASNDFNEGVQDTKLNTTRFFIIQKTLPNDSLNFKNQKTSIFIESKKDKAALLYNILRPFAKFGLNMSFLHSRSNLDKPWVYNFFLDFYNHTDKPENTAAVLDILKQFDAVKISVLGSYNSIK